MAKTLTPIERAIAGEPQERQARYMAKRAKQGLTRVAVWVPVERIEELHEVARGMVAAHLAQGSQGD